MNLLTRILCLISVIFYFAGCTRSTPNSGDVKVRIIKDDGAGNYPFTTVELKSVKDLRGMVGSNAVIRYGGTWNCYTSTCSSADSEVDGNHAPNAKFIDNGDYLIPADYKSLIMTTAMYHFEAVKDYFDTFKGNEGLTFPATVNVDVNVMTPNYYGGQSAASNNAFYYPPLDSFFLIPFENDEGITIPLNGGILAHEYSHRVFKERVRRRITAQGGDLFKSIMVTHDLNQLEDKAFPADKSTYIAFSMILLGGFDEGIADYFAYTYTGNPNFIEPSFRGLTTNSDRNLSTPKTFDLSEDQIDSRYIEATRSLGTTTMSDLEVHAVGARIAYYLYLISKEKGHEYTRSMILDSYNLMADVAAQRMIKKGPAKFKEILLAMIAKAETSDSLCNATKSVFPKMIVQSDSPCKKPEKPEQKDETAKTTAKPATKPTETAAAKIKGLK